MLAHNAPSAARRQDFEQLRQEPLVVSDERYCVGPRVSELLRPPDIGKKQIPSSPMTEEIDQAAVIGALKSLSEAKS